MKILPRLRESVYGAAISLATLTLAITAGLLAQGVADEDKSQAPRQMVQDECTFSDGGTITFGHKASGAKQSGGDVWQVGGYKATSLRVSERMLIPPLDQPLEIPAGSYTVFIDSNKGEPWTLIISKKTGEWGMPYPGEQYDLGRMQMGFDDSSRPPVETFAIGCAQHKDAPIFVWMESGSHVAYAKIMVAKTKHGKTEYLWH